MKPHQFAGPLFTDLYQLTMAAGYHRHGLHAQAATFSVFVRNPEHKRNYFVAAGLENVLAELERYRFRDEDIAYLRELDLFPAAFLDDLTPLRFSGDIWALPEGTIFFAEEPLMEITAPLMEAQLIETFVLNTLGLGTLIATKASRCVYAAQGRPLVDFALRRTQGQDAGDQVARNTYLAGFAATSNVRAGKRFGLPLTGTMAHAFISAYPSEIEAFRAFVDIFPDQAILLIDTYDTLEGARNAAAVAREMKGRGQTLKGVRLDSGDMVALSRAVRAVLDEAGFKAAKIYASSGFDEFGIDAVVRAGAPIDAFGVGTKVGVSADAPYLDIVYKLVRQGGRDVRKLSPGKVTLAGKKQLFRLGDGRGHFREDVIGCRDEEMEGAAKLLMPVMAGGRRLAPDLPLAALRRRFEEGFTALDARYKDIHSYTVYPVRISPRLEALQK
ncbi:MAG: nicotinate phosphoribosyltransferase [Desulfobacterales bacterium]|nr:nicotinate phosphoribosyltransferase [Desulfobacterales bacterium]